MTEKFNPNKFQGYRKAIALAGNANVRRIYIWDKQKQRYLDPPRGNKYEARILKNGKRSSETFDNLIEAREWLNGSVPFKSSIETTASYSVKDLAEDWQRLGWQHLSSCTKIYYERMVRHLEPLHRQTVEGLHPKHIDEWLSYLKSPEVSKQFNSKRETFEKEFDMFKAMINWHIERNDETKLRSPFKKRHKQMLRLRSAPLKPRKFMYDDELHLWLQQLRSKSLLFYSMAVVQIHQVMRISEVSAMRWSNLNLIQREYEVSEHVIWPRKNGVPPEVVPGTKTNRNGRTYKSFLQQPSIKVLSEMFTRKSINDLIFTLDGSPLTYRQIQHAYDSAFKKANLPFRGTHICRHTGATRFLNETGDTLALQQMGDWANQSMALYYGKVSSTRAKEAILNAERGRLRIVESEEGIGYGSSPALPFSTGANAI